MALICISRPASKVLQLITISYRSGKYVYTSTPSTITDIKATIAEQPSMTEEEVNAIFPHPHSHYFPTRFTISFNNSTYRICGFDSSEHALKPRLPQIAGSLTVKLSNCTIPSAITADFNDFVKCDVAHASHYRHLRQQEAALDHLNSEHHDPVSTLLSIIDHHQQYHGDDDLSLNMLMSMMSTNDSPKSQHKKQSAPTLSLQVARILAKDILTRNESCPITLEKLTLPILVPHCGHALDSTNDVDKLDSICPVCREKVTWRLVEAL